MPGLRQTAKQRTRNGPSIFFAVACRILFEGYPEVAGVIVRLGECDGIDVSGDLRSHLAIRTASQARRLVKNLVGLAEEHRRLLIVRTWTVGAYPIGDLIWNPRTYHKIFGGIASPQLIVSHKYGDADFYRHLPLNSLIFEGEQRKLIEFQARREYEGFGEFPSFVGYDYERYRDELSKCKNFAGIHVWCQTGGWTRFSKVTFLPGSSLWNEINTAVTVALFRSGISADQAAIEFCAQRLSLAAPEPLVKLLRLSDLVMKGLWYLPEFSQTALYFRRLRLPPLLWVFWDTIVISRTLRRLVRRFVKDKPAATTDGFRILAYVDAMKALAQGLGLAGTDFDLQRDTLELVALAREYFLGDAPLELSRRIEERARAYRDKYPHGFRVSRDFSPIPIGKHATNLLLALSLRTRPRYRLIDRTVVNPGAGTLYRLVKRWGRSRLPSFARERAMGIEALLK